MLVRINYLSDQMPGDRSKGSPTDVLVSRGA
jgi:hypothetical protein